MLWLSSLLATLPFPFVVVVLPRLADGLLKYMQGQYVELSPFDSPIHMLHVT